MSGRPAVFLDRDGVLNELVPNGLGVAESPLQVADVRPIDGAAAAVRDLASAGYALVCVSNQPAAAKGVASVAQLRTVHLRLVELLAWDGALLDGSRLCLHHPDGVIPTLAGPCACRKPSPGMLLEAACELSLDLSRSWMVGDTDADVLAGKAAGCATILIEHPESAHKRSSAIAPDLRAGSLARAVAGLLSS
jgi:D-glycero-D-manno-heptose 1,7-bisphosphate phosphatase